MILIRSPKCNIANIACKFNAIGCSIYNCTRDKLVLHNWINLRTRLMISAYVFLYNVYKLNSVPSLRVLLDNTTNHRYNIRNNININVVRYNRALTNRSFQSWATALWNKLPNSIKKLDSLSQFRSNVVKLVDIWDEA